MMKICFPSCSAPTDVDICFGEIDRTSTPDRTREASHACARKIPSLRTFASQRPRDRG